MAAPAELSGSATEPAAGDPPGAAAGEPPGAAASVPKQAQAPVTDLPAPDVPVTDLPAPDVPVTDLPAPDVPVTDLAAPDVQARDLPTAGLPAADGQGGEGGADVVTEPDLEAAEAAGAGYAGGRRRTSPLAVAALIFGVLVLAGVAFVGLAIATHGFRSKTVVTVTYRPAAVFRLRAGECINSSQNGLAVTVLSCATPHQAEVFATFSLAGTSWPGSAAAQQEAGNGCASRISGYLNPQLLTAGLTQQYVFPDQKAWQAGVHTVICEVSSSTGPLTGSVRQAGSP
jgi:hypothetical protein